MSPYSYKLLLLVFVGIFVIVIDLFVPSRLVMGGNTWKHWMCWTTATMWTPRFQQIESFSDNDLFLQKRFFTGSGWERLRHAQHRVFQVGLRDSWDVWRAPRCRGVKIVSTPRGLLIVCFLLNFLTGTVQDPVEGEERCQSQCLVNEECQYRELCCK